MTEPRRTVLLWQVSDMLRYARYRKIEREYWHP